MSDALRDERARLERWSRAFARVVGWQPALGPLPEGEPARWSPAWAPAFSLTFEPRLDPIEMLGGTGHFAHRPALTAHLRAMGFAWSDGRVLTAPSPASFNRLANLTLGPDTGYRLAVIERDAKDLALGPWMRAYLSGRVPVQLASDDFYQRVIDGAAGDGLHFHFTSLAHDLTVHALNYQLVPRAAIDALSSRVIDALPERYAAWGEHPDAPGPLTLTTFFDNDLNRYCYAVWSRSESPADFARVFMEHLAQLTACLDLRVDETRRGLGDVASADTADLAPLAPWEFDLRAPSRSAPAEAVSDHAQTPWSQAVFRDPPSFDGEAKSLREAIAKALVRAPRLPVELPAFRLTLCDVAVDRRGIELRVGHEAPVAALRIEAMKGDAVVSLRRGPDDVAPAVKVTVREVHPSAKTHARALETMAERVQRAVTAAQWEEARALAKRLRSLPVGVPMGFYRQVVAGLEQPEGLIRTGFLCNQDCGLCWQDREWGGYDAEQILRWIEDLYAAGARSLIISGGEPTLDASLDRYLRHARALGFTQVTLETNAIQCSKPGVAERLRDAGLTSAFVSLHSGDAATSDAITRAPGTHARTVRGALALLSAGVPVKFNAVMSLEGLDHLAALPDFIDGTFGAHREKLLGLMLSYPTEPYDPALSPAIVPEPVKLRRVLRETLDRAFDLGLRPQGLDGPCGPPLCAFGADPRVTALRPVPGPLEFRQHLPACDGCAVRFACFGVRTADVDLYGAACATPLTQRPGA